MTNHFPGVPRTTGSLSPALEKSVAVHEHCSHPQDSLRRSGPFAAMSFCFAHNQQKNKNGQSPWNLRKLEEHSGLNVPFGSYVNYLPPSTTKKYLDRTKFTDRTTPGVILGYEIGYSGKWKRGCVVCPLEAFANVTLESTSKLVAAHVNQRITDKEDVHFGAGNHTLVSAD